MTSARLPVLLERLCTVLRSEIRQMGQPHGLQPVQVEALLYLSRCNRYSDTPQAVASYLSSTKGTVSQTLKVLERLGHLTKTQDPEDGRVVRLRLTSQGKRLARALAVPKVLQQAVEADAAGAERMAEDLSQLLAAMQRLGDQQTFGTCHTCRFFLREDRGFRCGLTKEPLTASDSKKICREHEPDEQRAG